MPVPGWRLGTVRRETLWRDLLAVRWICAYKESSRDGPGEASAGVGQGKLGLEARPEGRVMKLVSLVTGPGSLDAGPGNPITESGSLVTEPR